MKPGSIQRLSCPYDGDFFFIAVNSVLWLLNRVVVGDVAGVSGVCAASILGLKCIG
jgi:hypothetical protein